MSIYEEIKEFSEKIAIVLKIDMLMNPFDFIEDHLDIQWHTSNYIIYAACRKHNMWINLLEVMPKPINYEDRYYETWNFFNVDFNTFEETNNWTYTYSGTTTVNLPSTIERIKILEEIKDYNIKIPKYSYKKVEDSLCEQIDNSVEQINSRFEILDL